MRQLPLPALSRLRVQPTHLLPAGMEITSYNHHLRRLLSFPASLSSNQDYRVQSSLRSYPISSARSFVLSEGRVLKTYRSSLDTMTPNPVTSKIRCGGI